MREFGKFDSPKSNDRSPETDASDSLEGRLISQEEINELAPPEQAYAYVTNIREILDAQGRLSHSLTVDARRVQEDDNDSGLLFQGHTVDYANPANPYVKESYFSINTEYAGIDKYGRALAHQWPQDAPRGILAVHEIVRREDGEAEIGCTYRGAPLDSLSEEHKENVFTPSLIERLKEVSEQLKADIEAREE
jgi:hypothetical protein